MREKRGTPPEPLRTHTDPPPLTTEMHAALALIGLQMRRGAELDTALTLARFWHGEPQDERVDPLTRSVGSIGLEVRIANNLERHGLLTVGDVLAKTRDELRALDQFGPGAIEQIVETCGRVVGRVSNVPKRPHWYKQPTE